MIIYSEPFRLHLVKDPETGKRRQLTDKKKAEDLAQEIAEKAKCSIDDVLSPSRYFYVYEYAAGSKRGRRINTRLTTKYKAKQWALRRVKGGQGPYIKSTASFFEALDEWIAHLKIKRRSERTIADYTYLLEIWKKHFGDIQLSAITREDVAGFYKKLEAGHFSKRKGKKPSERTLNLNLTVLRSFFGWARTKKSYVEIDPTDRVDHWEEYEVEPRILSKTEISRLLKCCVEPYGKVIDRKSRGFKFEQEFIPPPWLYPIVVAGLTTLLRLKNILTLTWGQIDLKAGTIRVAAKKAKGRREILVPLSESFKRCLADLPVGKDGDPVFGRKLGNIRSAFNSAVARAGLKNVNFHCLRKSGSDHLLKGGTPQEVVQNLGSWADREVMLKHYRGRHMEEMRDASRRLDELVS